MKMNKKKALHKFCIEHPVDLENPANIAVYGIFQHEIAEVYPSL